MFGLTAFLLQNHTPETVWIEAETMATLRGANFSYMRAELQTKDAWSLSGPDVAAAWTQGGESEFMSIAARADEPAGTAVRREVIIPATGEYSLWVRYCDYRERSEQFQVEISQDDKSQSLQFGASSVVDELDPMKLLWDWSYAWDRRKVNLNSGPATITVATIGSDNARRCLDCLCLTTDSSYKPVGRNKPNFASWRPLAEMRQKGMPDVEPFIAYAETPSWEIPQRAYFLWNAGQPWLEEQGRKDTDRVEPPFAVDPPLLKDFLSMFRGKDVPVFGNAASGPVLHIPHYPAALSKRSPFLDWIDHHPDTRFAMLLNYAEPQWSPGVDRKAIYSTLRRCENQFAGFIAGESIAYANVDAKGFEAAIRRATSRNEVLDAIETYNTQATVAKFSEYYGTTLAPREAWSNVVSCLSANNEAYCHALAAWGVKRIGHENSGNSPSYARRLAFLRGAARQFGCELVDYQSANLGDSATMFSREHYFYPASSRYIIDNSYDAFAGAGITWLLKDYLLAYVSGVDYFYNEQGIDMFWKPGGNAAGDEFPVQLSPKGKVADAVQRVTGRHPRPKPYAPIAFLLDRAHGYSQERFQPGSFALDPSLNPDVLTPGRHEASIRAWFDIAYFPAPETQNDAATAIRQTYVNGLFGDIFDVIVTARGKSDILTSYRAVILAGEIELDDAWGRALVKYVQGGGTLVICAQQLRGIIPKELHAEFSSTAATGSGYPWIQSPAAPSATYTWFEPDGHGTSIATTIAGKTIVSRERIGRGQIIAIGVPLGIGIDGRPVPFLGQLLHHLTQDVLPVRVYGDVEWTLGKLPNGGWLVGMLNNNGIDKPQHGINPTDHSQSVIAKLRARRDIGKSEEWMTGDPPVANGRELQVTIPAGAVRLIAIYPE